jgi:hypothetical protein
MFNKLSKTIMLALAVALVAAPLALAQTPGSPSDRPSTSPSMGGPGTTGSKAPGTTSSSMGTMSTENTIPATVADVNHQKHTVKLHMQSGETVELKVPEQSLASLSKGDSVQVSINKAPGQSHMPSTGQSNMPSTQPSQPGSTPGTTR